MRKGGLEPPRPFGHQLLRLARLPLRHFRADPGIVGYAGTAKWLRFEHVKRLAQGALDLGFAEGAAFLMA